MFVSLVGSGTLLLSFYLSSRDVCEKAAFCPSSLPLLQHCLIQFQSTCLQITVEQVQQQNSPPRPERLLCSIIQQLPFSTQEGKSLGNQTVPSAVIFDALQHDLSRTVNKIMCQECIFEAVSFQAAVFPNLVPSSICFGLQLPPAPGHKANGQNQAAQRL